MAVRFWRCLAVLMIGVLALIGVVPAQGSSPAQDKHSTPLDIINTVNALRAVRGLAPYQVDAGIMAYAQEHSKYQASIHTSTHQHSDGTTSIAHGMMENVAGGDVGWLDANFAVYEIWQDPVHMKTMVGYTTGWVGAGVADDGETVYYTLNVRPGNGEKIGGGDPNATPTKPIPIVPLVTMTVRPNGCLVHPVGYGQSLWAIAIAYGVKMEQIRNLNAMPAGSIDIYAGQKLFIKCGIVLTPTFTPTVTSLAPTATPVTPTVVAAARVTVSHSPTPTLPLEIAQTGKSPPVISPLAAGLFILFGGVMLVIAVFALVGGRKA